MHTERQILPETDNETVSFQSLSIILVFTNVDPMACFIAYVFLNLIPGFSNTGVYVGDVAEPVTSSQQADIKAVTQR